MEFKLPINLSDRILRDLKIAGFAPSTIDHYAYHVTDFARFHKCLTPDTLGLEEIRDYLLYLKEQRNASKSSSNIAAAALRFFFKTTVNKDFAIQRIPYQKKPRTLPEVLAPVEVKTLIEKIYDPVKRLMLAIAYSGGLRVGELLNLRVKDVDSKRMTIFIRRGKGQKDRYVHLSPLILAGLRRYFSRCAVKPTDLLFPRMAPDKTMFHSTLRKAFIEAKKLAGILKPATMHTLRHSYATHLLENGASIITVQHLLGHESLKTTLIYLHVAKPVAEVVESPIDRLWPECNRKA